MDSLLQDLRFSTRVLLRSPGFTLVAAVTLALGIGANASIFSLVNGLMFRSPAGIHEPDRLVQIARSYESAPRWDNFSWPAMELIRDESRMLSGVAVIPGGPSSSVVGPRPGRCPASSSPATTSRCSACILLSADCCSPRTT